MADADLISKEEADNKRLDAEISKNNLEKAVKRLQASEDKLKKTRILSPIDGIIISLPIVEGQVAIGGPTAAQGTVLMKVANLSAMKISTHINQVDVARMKESQTAKITVDALEDIQLSGEVCFIAHVATIKNNIKGFTVDVLVQNPDPRIRPGMSANVSLPIVHAENALSIPIEAVFYNGSKKVVYLKKDKELETREIEVGVVTSSWAEIKSGLKAGDIVSLTRPKKLDEKIGVNG